MEKVYYYDLSIFYYFTISVFVSHILTSFLLFVALIQNITVEERVSLLEIQVTDLEQNVSDLDQDVNFLFDETVLQDARLFSLE